MYVKAMKAEQIFQTLAFKCEDDGNDYEIVMEKFDEYFIPKRSTIYESTFLLEELKA